MGSLGLILLMVIKFVYWVVIANVVMSWLISFNVLNIHQPFVRAIWTGLNRITEPVFRPIRNFLPQTGGLDFTPIVAIFGLIALEILITRNLL
ncbi:MAG: YggT family protein [Pikeienuella sp.]